VPAAEWFELVGSGRAAFLKGKETETRWAWISDCGFK